MDDDLTLIPGGEPDDEVDVAVERVPWEGETVDAADAMFERALSYGMYVNTGRALPDVRDGLKPVQRRIVFAMDEIGARAGRPYVKSATVIGHVIGHYHPHGDVAVYDAMVRLAQGFAQNVPLVDGQGNWGSVGPKDYSDPAAAYRYCVTGETRVRLADGRSVRIDRLGSNLPPNSESHLEVDILGRRGEPQRATTLFHSGQHDTFRLSTLEGYGLTATGNHPLLCLGRDEEGLPVLQWRLLENLHAGDLVAIVLTHAAADDPDETDRRRAAEIAVAVAAGDAVPDEVFEATPGFKLAFVRSLAANRFARRAPDVQLLLTELGVAADGDRLADGLRAVARTPRMSSGDGAVATRTRVATIFSGYSFAAVTSVAPAGRRPVYSLRVDSSDHAFVTNGLVSHNTEARLTPAASDWLRDMRPEIVEYRPNFSERRSEPFVLPVAFPNLLVNGSKGIGWSMACEIPPHNLAEACEAAIVLAEDPEATLDDLLAVLPGPDFPTGGIIVDPDELPAAYAKGSGTFRLQARYHVEQLPGNLQAVVVTELPYGVSPDQIVAEVVKAARAEKITDVTEMPKNLSDRNGLRVQVRCKRGGNVTKLVADLMRHSSLRVTVGINITVLADGVPRQIGLREALDRFVSFRFEVVTKRLQHERDELLRELHRLVALLAALDDIDEVIRIVRESDDDEHAREQLKLRLKVLLHGGAAPVPLDDEQAQQILDMPIKRLARLNRLKLASERKTKGERVDEIGAILDSYEALRTIVVGELRDTAGRLGTPRRTLLGGETRVAAGDTQRRADVAVLAAPRTDVLLFATRGGACAIRPREDRIDRVPITVGAGDAVVTAIATDTASELNAFTSDGQVMRLRVADIPIEARISRGTRAVALSRGSLLAGLAPLAPVGGHVLLVTAGGEIKRCEAAVFAGSHMGGSPAFDLPAGDAVVAVVPHADGDEILLHTAHGRTLRLAAAKVRPVKSAGAGGVAGINLDRGDRVVAAGVAAGDLVLVMHELGHGKVVPLGEYPLKGRATGGVVSANPGAPKRQPAGGIAAAAAVPAAGEVLVMTASGGLARIAVGQLEQSARAAVSRPLVDVVVGDEIVTALALH